MAEEVALPTYETLLTEAIRSLAIDSGTVTVPPPAGIAVLQDDTKGWPVDAHRGRLVKVIRGAGLGQTRVVRGNTARVLSLDSVWTIPLNQTSVYVILGEDLARKDKGIQTILTLANLAAGATSLITDCQNLDLRHGAASLALTVAATYNALATRGLKVHVRTSPDGTNWDTQDWDSWDAQFGAGLTIRETQNYDTDPLYIRVLIENLDPARAITNISVIASVGA